MIGLKRKRQITDIRHHNSNSLMGLSVISVTSMVRWLRLIGLKRERQRGTKRDRESQREKERETEKTKRDKKRQVEAERDRGRQRET